MIVETDASNIGYEGIIKQKLPENKNEQIVRFYSGLWLGSKKKINYKKENFIHCPLYFKISR